MLHTTAFRRLQGKTQVFVVTEGDYYRTRITHTLEVAQIGRTVARALGANEDLVEGICLAHDLGHPPFGHAGERALNDLMAGYGGFAHNRQSFRIITELEQRYPEFSGLNLTFEFREGIVKHDVDRALEGAPMEFEPHLRGTLEAQIASFADELAYNAHDLDDGLRAGLIDARDLRDVEWWRRASESAGVDVGQPLADMERHRVVRRLVGLMVGDLLDETAARMERMCEAGGNDADAVRHWHVALVALPPTSVALNLELKAWLFENLYSHPRVMRMTNKGDRVLRDLFKAYVDEPRMLGDGPRRQLAQLPLQRVVCDYIAGMTDRFALDEHARLFDPHERV